MAVSLHTWRGPTGPQTVMLGYLKNLGTISCLQTYQPQGKKWALIFSTQVQENHLTYDLQASKKKVPALLILCVNFFFYTISFCEKLSEHHLP